ncbi:MAG: DUF4249 domain-containing protein [bacterium]
MMILFFRQINFNQYCPFKRVVLFLILVLIFLTSCIKELDGYFEHTEPFPVVNCMLNPEDMMTVYLCNSSPVDGPELFPPIPDAIVEIFREGELLPVFRFNDSLYLNNYYPISGFNYRLQIINTVYDTISAYTSIPPVPLITNTKLYFTDIYDDYGDRMTGAEFTIQDDGDTRDYYCFYLCDFHNYYNLLNEPVIKNEGITEYTPKVLFFSDALFNGNNYTMHFLYNGASEPRNPEIPKSRKLFFRSISKEYYDFLGSWTRHRFNQNTIEIEGNVRYNLEQLYFKGEPVDLFTNILGGKGLFAGYSEVIIELKANK